MRISRTTVILLVANFIAFGLVWKATSGHQSGDASQTQLFPATLTKLVLSEGPERIVLESRATGWRVTEPFDWPANIWTVQRLLDELRFVGNENGFDVDEVKANGSDLKAYGLEVPRWNLKVTAETGATLEARIGVQPGTNRHFLLTEDGRRIIPLPDAMAAALAARPETYRVDRIFEIADFEARAVSIRHRTKDGELVTALSAEVRPRIGQRLQLPEWRFETPFDALSDPDATGRAVADLTNLRASKFVALTDDATGLTTPVLRLSLEGNSRRQVLLVGNPASGQPSMRCAKLEENSSVFLVEARLLDDWFAARETLASSRPADFDSSMVTGFTIAAGGRTITLHRLEGAAPEARWEIPVAPGSTATKRREADTKIVARFLEAVAQLRAVRRKAAGGGPSLPAVMALANPGTATIQTLELEFGTDRILLSFTDDPDKGAGTRVVHAKGSPLAAVCDVSLLDGGHQNVEPQAWRKRTVAQLSQGARVSGLRLSARADGKVLGEARLGPDGNWAGSGRLDPANARRLATQLAEVSATEFPGRDIGAGGWKYELRVTDQAASGGGAASETIRTYLCSAPFGVRSLLLRDEADEDDFLLAPGLAEILIPLLAEPGR
ncbi:MAG: hypothetical protein CK541_01430 [Opitutia bacterium]|nr:DUF4340 domain-containing protein [Opitutales bacterium]PHX80118.1 MAG: hypothetical protein CK541_01430 [Opitutae bacterium]